MAIRLTNNNIDDVFFSIAGNNAGWRTSDGRDDELYLYNGSSIIQLTRNNSNDDTFQGISDRYVLWESDTGRPFNEFFLSDGRIRRTVQLTNNNKQEYFGADDGAIAGRYVAWENGTVGFFGSSSDVQIYDGTRVITLTNNGDSYYEGSSEKYIVYEDSGEFYLYDGSRSLRLTNNDEIDFFEGIFGNYVVWQAEAAGGADEQYELFVYNGTTIVQLTNRETSLAYEAASNRYVVFTNDRDDDGLELYIYNGNQTIQLADDNNDFQSIGYSGFQGVSNRYVVWKNFVPPLSSDDNNELYAYNGTSTIRLTNNLSEDTFQGVSDRYVVWTDGGDGQLHLLDGSRIVQLTNNGTVSDTYIGIFDNSVVWTGNDGVDEEIFVYDGIRRQLTNNRILDTYLAADNGYVVWQSNDGVDNELYAYKAGRITKLTNNANNLDSFKGIFGNYVAWTSNDGDNEIYLYNGSSIQRVTNNRTDDIDPVVSGNNIFWRNFDGRDYELYTEKLRNLVPNISISNALVTEGLNANAIFTVRLSRASTTPITLRYTTFNRSARAGLDYQARSGLITFRPGQTSAIIGIRLLNNNLSEPNESFQVTLAKVNPSDAIFSKAIGVGIITDTLRSPISRLLPVGVENLSLIGNRAIIGTGNALNNTITGSGANNRLSGLQGNDRLLGLAGDDLLNGGLGSDRVIGGIGNDILVGAPGNDFLLGGVGNDILNGGSGRNVLIGGLGADRFVYGAPNGRIDRINDFVAIADTIVVSSRGFGGGLRPATLPVDRFRVGAGAADASDRFIYNPATGVLSFDADGIGAIGRIPIAVLNAGLPMSAADIFVTA
ncbi:MAG: hypothetical protein HC847_05835 [Hydrococcus sp. RU_2_2]|nr:hypothetical protein [Hydrococcus sp. RU_2_2]NJP17785.1 hypothetical protein [Hydrococcus sp. CRU_1_1]